VLHFGFADDRWKWGGILQDSVTLSNTKVIQVLQIIIRPENLPVYLHCLDGTHVTGLVVMCFRKLQSWNLSTSTAEFCQFEKDAEISREESQFVEAFRGEIEIPPVIPKWLWQARIFVPLFASYCFE
jgi:tyrosine-protein phosphatase OCA6